METYTDQQEILKNYILILKDKEQDLENELNLVKNEISKVREEILILEPKVEAEKILKT